MLRVPIAIVEASNMPTAPRPADHERPRAAN